MIRQIIEYLRRFFNPVPPEEPAPVEVPGPMKASEKIIDCIKQWEGYRGTAYKPVPTEKEYTIGWGHYGADVTAGMTITPEEGTRLLRGDIYSKCEKPLDDLCIRDNVTLTQYQYDALVSFIFNLGIGALSGSTLWKKVVAGDFAGAADEFPKWRLAGGKVLQGLVTRRAAERQIWLGGGYPVA